jgi:Mn-containing catalase
MFHHVKELQFNARVSKPDPKFARLLLEQFGGGNGELKAAMQYFVQAFSARQPYPKLYDMLMDIAAEEFSHSKSSALPSPCCSAPSTEN